MLIIYLSSTKMRRYMIFVSLLLGCLISGSCGNNEGEDQVLTNEVDEIRERPNFIYTIYVPKTIRVGYDVIMSVSISNSENPVRLASSLLSSDNQTSFEKVTDIGGGETAQIALGKLPLGYSGSSSFTLTVVGSDLQTGARLFTERTADFNLETKGVSILIQTDKAIYQPAQTIKFRALCMTPDLRPVRGSVSYQVEDPSGNVVLLEPSANLSTGVAGGEIALIRDAPLGTWKVSFDYQGYKESLPVSVEVYKLPKFEVEVETSSYIHPGSQGLSIKLKATYTFGQPVSGNATLTLKEKESGGFSPIFFGRPFSIRPNPRSLERVIPNFAGEETIFISAEDIATAFPQVFRNDGRYDVIGVVTEGLTGISYNQSVDLESWRSKIKVDVLQKPAIVKSGLSYQALVRVTERDGSLLSRADQQENNLIVVVDYSFPFRPPFAIRPPIVPALPDAISNVEEELESVPTPPPRPQSRRFVFPIPPDGVVPVEIEIPPSDFQSITFAVFTNTTESGYRYSNSWTANRAQSPSNSFIQISASGAAARGGVTVGSNAEVLIRTTEPVPFIRILIISRGRVISDLQHPIADPGSMQTQFSFLVTPEMNPSLLLLASYIRRENNEVVADYVKLNVEISLQNQVTITSNEKLIDAGTPVNIRVDTSSAGGYVGIRAIDQSVLLLKSGNDITRERVVNELEGYSLDEDRGSRPPFFYWFSRPSGADSAGQVFDKAGIIILTNADVFRPPAPIFPVYFAFQAFGGAEFGRAVAPVSASSSSQPPPSSTSVRSFFPESWIWSDATTGSDGSATFQSTAPDTITSWIISAFSISEDAGLGIANPYKLTVFRNFFVSLNLPLKITRGEIIIVQAIVFNYHNQDLNVAVYLKIDNEDRNGIILMQPGSSSTRFNGVLRRGTIPANGAISIKYPIRITKLNEVPISVTAYAPSTSDQDTVVRKVFVRPEGIQQCYSVSSLIEINRSPTASTNNPQEVREDLVINIPPGIVPGSEKVTLHAYGNILGSSMSNLGRLLKAPGGCGEQNMLSFAPDVFVTLYLKRVQELDVETRRKAFKHIIDGYMNELKYKRKDGSFSAFGGSDKSGSTWLTAFVAKCFMFARDLQPSLVEEKVIDNAINYLVAQQSKTGVFNEPGRVIHTEMQGRVNSPITMTAYVLISLTETSYGSGNLEWDSAIRSARSYLEMHLNSTLNDVYALSLVTYALQLTGSTSASYALDYLRSQAVTEGPFVYWHVPDTGASSYSSNWRPPYSTAPTNDIEMTSYALLTYFRRGDVASALPVLKWLISKQNDLGGYSSTQDTVLAIQALSTVAGLFAQREQNLNLVFTHSADEDYRQSLTITETNANVFNTYSPPDLSGNLSVVASGVGLGVAQLSVCYNTPVDPYDVEPFNCTVDVQSPNNNAAHLEFCCSQDETMEATGMFLFEIGLLNGFTVDLEAEKKRNKNAKMVELDEDSVNVYYDELGSGQRLCANIELKRSSEVASIKPAPLSAYSYYKPDHKVSLLYNVESLSATGECDVCGSDCVGCPV